ncbi:Fasciclin-like arabinogalactan protein 6 [Asimina triloba]
MATPPSPIPALALALALFLTSTLHVQAQSPASAPEPLNLTAVLEKGGQFTTLMRLLVATHTYEQLVNQLNNSDQGLTLFAPTDNAFNNLKAGTLNTLSQEQQVALLLYHVLPRYYSLDMFDTISNPTRTEAGGNDGYGLNFTTSANQVNVSTGVVDHVPINNALRSKFPLAVYQLDQVLLPLDLFRPKPNNTEAPAPAGTPPVKKSPASSSSASADAPSASEDSAPNTGSRMVKVGWGGLLLIMMVGIVW